MKRLLALFCAAVLLVTAMSVMPLTASAVTKGDVNGDGRIDTLDVRLVMRGALGADTVTKQLLFAGDMDPDCSLKTADARVLMRQVLTSDTTEVEKTDYAHPSDSDCWGENSIALIGDSISYGAWASDPLPENNYVSYVKKAIQKANNGLMNYGFASSQDCVYAKVDGTEYYTYEIHKKISSTNWSSSKSGDRLFFYGYTSTTAWASLQYYLRTDYVSQYDYFCVYYQTQSNGGLFCLADGNDGEVADITGSTLYVSTKDSQSITKRTEFYPLSGCKKDSSGRPIINIFHDGTTNPVTITGIGYYKSTSPSVTTFNSFTLSEQKLCDVSNTVLSQAASADTLIMALGYNDANFGTAAVLDGTFAKKIDHLISECNKNNTKVIVSDHVWYDNSEGTARYIVKRQLRRLAKETGGVYIDQRSMDPTRLENSLKNTAASGKPGDGIHPNDDGHKMLAENIIAAMGLEWAASWT